jgi:hypothetical protein
VRIELRRRGKESLWALADDEDADLLNQYRWYSVWRKTSQTPYAQTSVVWPDGSRHSIYMHGLLAGSGADHINGNGLDNRRVNLRPATRAQQQWNRGIPRNASSQFKGVRWDNENKRWYVRPQVNGKLHFLGRYVDEEEAARVYDRWAIRHLGEHARLNFPEEVNDEQRE